MMNLNKLKYAEYLIKYNDKINQIRSIKYHCKTGEKIKVTDIPSGVIDFSYFYYSLNEGYVNGAVCALDELPEEFCKKYIHNSKNNLFNSRSRNISAMKKALKKQADWICSIYPDFKGTTSYTVHNFKPSFVGIPHSLFERNFRGSKTYSIKCLLLDLQTDNIVTFSFDIKKNNKLNKWVCFNTLQNCNKLIYTEDDLQKKNEFLLQ